MEYVAPIGGWPKGVDNVHADYEIPSDTLRRGVNIDVLDSGKVRRRKGYTLALAISGAHSLWSDGANAYFAQNNTLNQFFWDGKTSQLGAFACGVNRVSFVKVADEIYITSKTARAAIRNGILTSWGIDTPVAPPTVSASVGELVAGTYFLAVTYLDADGRESGASALSSITLASTGGIATTAIPNSTDPHVTAKRLYMSTTDGEVLYRVKELAPTDQFVTISVLPNGAELRTAYMEPPPFGDASTYYNGRIFVVDSADPNTVYYTEAYAYGLVNKRKNYYRFGAPVTALATVDDGIFVMADNTYFIAGAGSDSASQVIVLEAGAVAGSVASIPDTTNAIWMTERGAVIGKNGGVIEILAGKQVNTGGMIDGAAFVREEDSIRQYVVVGSNSEASALQAGSYATAEIIRRTA